MTPKYHTQSVVYLSDAEAPLMAAVLCHGRGATPESLKPLVLEIMKPMLGVLAPPADLIQGMPQWYPNSFLAPIDDNEPFLTDALDAVGVAVSEARSLGLPADRILLGGFSQGACLAVEYAARNPEKWAGVAALSGALIGTSESDDDTPVLEGAGGEYADKKFEYEGSLRGTPVLLASSEEDTHIPVERLKRSAEVLEAMDADVTTMIFPGGSHTIFPEEIDWINDLTEKLL